MPVQATKQQQSAAARGSYADVEHIYHDWDKAIAKNDAAALLGLYAPDATLESPLVSHLMGTERGICQGHDELKRLFEILAPRKPKLRQFYRTEYFTDGRKIVWEYPHETPNDEQMDFVEVMEIENGPWPPTLR